MPDRVLPEPDRLRFEQLNEVRAAALEHARIAQDLARQRRALMTDLLGDGYSQSDIAREMGVTRQAVQKMLAIR